MFILWSLPLKLISSRTILITFIKVMQLIIFDYFWFGAAVGLKNILEETLHFRWWRCHVSKENKVQEKWYEPFKALMLCNSKVNRHNTIGQINITSQHRHRKISKTVFVLVVGLFWFRSKQEMIHCCILVLVRLVFTLTYLS